MRVSLYHRLRGIWGQATVMGSMLPAGDRSWAIAHQCWQQFIQDGDCLDRSVPLGDEPLGIALALLPAMLFYHEDPDYLGDRLQDWSLPPAACPVVGELAQLLSAILRERVMVTDFFRWLQTHSSFADEGLKQLLTHYDQGQPWRRARQRIQQVQGDNAGAIAAQELMTIYGALLWGQGNPSHCLALADGISVGGQVWLRILLAAWRGDRQGFEPCPRQNPDQTVTLEVQQFWSRWSGLPPENQLKLEQLPVIANCQVLQWRPSLKLLSQHPLHRA